MPQPHLPQNILVTGATGLVGSHIVKLLLQQGCRVRALKRSSSSFHLLKDVAQQVEWVDGDILDVLSLAKAMEGSDAVVHAAAYVSFNPKQVADIFKVNVEGTANVVNTCLDLKIPRLVHISSVAALGIPKDKGTPTDERAKWADEYKSTRYGLSKYLAELEVWRGYEEGLNVAVLNPAVILGPNVADASGSGSLIHYVAKGKPFYTTGILNYVDVRDVAKAALMALTQMDGRRYILAAGSTTFETFFNDVAAVLNKPAPKYKLSRWLAELGWRAEWIKSNLTGKAPFITRETARNAFRQTKYNGELITKELEFNYTPLANTLNYCVLENEKMSRDLMVEH